MPDRQPGPEWWDFKNTVVILTSNLGTSDIQKNLGFGSDKEDDDYDQMRTKLLALFKKSFRLEFVNRLNEIVIFRRLTRKMVVNIVSLITAQVTKRVVAERGIAVEIDPAAMDWIIEKGYDPLFGARPLKRVVKRNIEEPLAEEILKGTVKTGGKVRVRAARRRWARSGWSSPWRSRVGPPRPRSPPRPERPIPSKVSAGPGA